MKNKAHEYFLSVSEKYTHIPTSEWKKIKACLKPLDLDENEFFIMQGDMPDRFAFIISEIFGYSALPKAGMKKHCPLGI